MDTEKMKPILKRVDETLPPRHGLRFTVSREPVGLFDTKLGGIPYFPKNMPYPTGKANAFNGKPLTLLVQLNFEQLPPVPDFPTKGILQIFIAPDDLYGMSPTYGDAMTRQDNFRVVYHDTIITDESKLLGTDDLPHYTDGEDDCLPFTGTYKLNPQQPEKLYADWYDHRFNDAFVAAYDQLHDDAIEDMWDVSDLFEEEDDEGEDVTASLLGQRNGDLDTFIGGYPVFTQDDPRFEESIADCDTVLFESISLYDADNGIDIMWGDMGTGSFLIPHDRLKALDFSRVLYNFDCG